MGGNEHDVSAHSGSSDNPQSQQTLFEHGVLHVDIFQAKDIKGDEVGGVGRADPYLKVKLGTASNGDTFRSEYHQDGGSNPVWNTRFKFPLRNGGTPEHNILEIEIWNRNKITHGGKDNRLGHIRIGDLASWIGKHPHSITPEYWYPIFYKRRRSSKEKKRGSILMKFYFSKVDPGVFARGEETEARHEKIESSSGSSATEALYNQVSGNWLSTMFGTVGTYVGIVQPLLIFFLP